MPFSIYLDDCSDENLLIARLRQAGYVVVSPRECGTVGMDDRDHLEYASRHGHALLTQNPQDFIDRHEEWQEQGLQHAGILLVYRDNDPTRDMTAADILRSLGKLLTSRLAIRNSIQVLNHWR
jgi:Domain of unknown function (DUF5615)